MNCPLSYSNICKCSSDFECSHLLNVCCVGYEVKLHTITQDRDTKISVGCRVSKQKTRMALVKRHESAMASVYSPLSIELDSFPSYKRLWLRSDICTRESSNGQVIRDTSTLQGRLANWMVDFVTIYFSAILPLTQVANLDADSGLP